LFQNFPRIASYKQTAYKEREREAEGFLFIPCLGAEQQYDFRRGPDIVPRIGYLPISAPGP
jgi:hypothetical protein